MNPAIQEIAQVLALNEAPAATLDACRIALDSHDAQMFVVSMDGILLHLNKSALALVDASSSRGIVGKPIESFDFAWHTGEASVFDRLENGEHTTYFEIDRRGYACEASLLHDRLNNPIGVLEVISPEDAVVANDGIDELTGLCERSRFLSETRRLLDRHPEESYAIVYWDVIRFSVINNVFSPATGDMVLKNIAESVKTYVGTEGTYGRLVDDHFVFCVPERKLNVDVLRRHAEVTLISDTAMYTFKSTFGVYYIDDRSISVLEMCNRATYARDSITDMQLAEGAFYAIYSDEMNRRAAEDHDLSSQLSFALAENQIIAYFQPIYDIETGELASAEALARWVHPDKGLVPPGRFVPLFERNGMITELDHHIWDSAASFLERRVAAGKPAVPISINVSRVDFFNTTLIDDLDYIVQSHNIPHKLLRVEITESAYSDDPSRILDIAHQLHDRGFTVMLDDFGSGYSSLNMLKDLPVDILKLDMGFLSDFESTGKSAIIVKHMVTMAHELGLKIVSEGVETAEQRDFLHSVGCHLAQGYLYARPQPPTDFDNLLDVSEILE